MTKTLKDLYAQRAELDTAISQARKKASEEALRKVHELVAEFGFTAQQVFPWKPLVKKVAEKYRDEKTGATWTGRGRAPAWIAGKNREDFLIERPRAPQGPFLAEMAAASSRRQD
ncbi:H-NS histone family protein [Acidovorax sp. LjRoot129]|uniref:H-NS histone family protein n=1 Tax=Acidovorax sp. LjRoot129 TaxID=3342260 RepID=UPI003ECF6906